MTYSAIAIERILSIKDRVPGQRPTLRLSKELLVPFLEELFTGLFAVRTVFSVAVDPPLPSHFVFGFFLLFSFVVIFHFVLPIALHTHVIRCDRRGM